MKTYTVRGEFEMTVVVKKDDLIERVIKETGDFEHFPYFFAGDDTDREVAGVEMLAINCGLRETDLTVLDGWADCADDDIEIQDVRTSLEDCIRDGTPLQVVT